MADGKEKTKTLSDEDFVDGIITGDRRVMELCYLQYFPMVRSLVLHNNGSEQDARDIYQDAFVIVHEQLKFEGLKIQCKLKTYLYSVCRRLWLKELYLKNRIKSVVQINDLDEFLEVEDVAIDKVILENRFLTMEQSLEKLGEPCATMLKAFYIKKQSMEEISELFGYTNADNAKNQKYKCLKRLKKIFFDMYKG